MARAGDGVNDAQRPLRRRVWWRRLLPAALLAAAIALAFAFGVDDYLSFEALRENRVRLLDLVARYGHAAGLVYLLAYAAVVALSLPGAAFMSLTGGFLFGAVLATVYTVIGATVGATVIFLIARTALGDVLARRAGPAVRRMEQGFRDDALSYMLVLRLIPIFPFWLVNIVPAFLGVRLRTYVVATFLGIIPGSLVYASVGNGLGAVFDAGGQPDLGIIFKPEIFLPIVGLAILALLPVAYRKLRTRQA